MTYISKYKKNEILKLQNYKCCGVSNYECPLKTKTNGYFDESGYEIDHVNEISLSRNNNIQNLQALCPNCHSYKTKEFMKIYINKKYLKKYTNKDTSDYLHKVYSYCKKIILEFEPFTENIFLSGNYYDDKLHTNFHLVQFPKNVNVALLIKYISQSLIIKAFNLSSNNIFIIIKN